MSKIDAYFAGLIDGEGCLTLQSRRCEGRSDFIPMMQVGMADEAIIRALHDTYGGRMRVKKLYKHYKQVWEWRISHAQARSALKRIYPYLRVKKDAADKLLAYWKERGRK